MASQQISTNTFGCSKWVVSADATQGTHTTIAGATASASSGDIILIRQGTFTENFTAKAGVTYSGLPGSEQNPAVTIAGKITYTDAGAVTFANIRLQTNADFFLVCSGSNSCQINLNDCYANCTNNTGISFTNSNSASSVDLTRCNGNLETTGIAYFASSSTGSISYENSDLSNTGSSATASTISSGTLIIANTLFSSQITTSATSAVIILNSRIGSSVSNSTALTHGGSGVSSASESSFVSGTASAISIGAGASLVVINCSVSSSNTNAITGIGTISHGGIWFNSSSTINTTTQNVLAGAASTNFSGGLSGVENLLQMGNSSNTASSAARIKAVTAGSTAGDAVFEASTTTTSWSWGVDNSVTTPTADPFVIAQGTALGTNNIMSVATSGEINYPLQPAFLAYLPSNDNNVTGNGGAFTLGGVTALTEVFDQNGDFNTNGTFTAPVTGRYRLEANISLGGLTALMTYGQLYIITSNRNYLGSLSAIGLMRTVALSADLASMDCVCFADMDANDTATVSLQINGEASNAADVLGAASGANSRFSGSLIA